MFSTMISSLLVLACVYAIQAEESPQVMTDARNGNTNNDNPVQSNLQDVAMPLPNWRGEERTLEDDGNSTSIDANNTCPPSESVIANALYHYCPQGFVVDGEDYTCFDTDGETPLCTGTVDYTLTPPACPQNIQSCNDFDQVCEENPQVDLCSVETNSFECWQTNLWCQGQIIRNETTHSECPPFDTISDCDDLYNLLPENADLCVCDERIVPDLAGPGTVNETIYECKDQAGIDAPIVCSGTVDPVQGYRDPMCPPAVAILEELMEAGCNTTFPDDALTHRYSCLVDGIEGATLVCGGTVILTDMPTDNETVPVAPPTTSTTNSSDSTTPPAPSAAAPTDPPIGAAPTNPAPVVEAPVKSPTNPPAEAPGGSSPTFDSQPTSPVAAPVGDTSPSADFYPTAPAGNDPNAPVLFHDDDSLPTVDSSDGLYNGGSNDSNGVFTDIWAIGNTTLLLFMSGFAVMFAGVWFWRRRQRQNKRYRGDQFYSGIESSDGDFEMQPTYRMAHEDYGGW